MTEVTKDIALAKGKQLVVRPTASAVSDAPNAERRFYPEPLAKYEEVVANSELFKDTLVKLHAQLGTKIFVPTIGGKELDLHRLFMEVTSRGGIDQVLKERKWKEVTSVFNFPPTATNASFILRKYYFSLLHHYEQIYFFGAREWSSPPTVPSHTSTSIPKFVEATGTSSESLTAARKRQRSTASHEIDSRLPLVTSSSATNAPLPTNSPVIGVIDGVFEHGYFVTVMVGTEKLKGVLYHTPDQAQQTPPITSVTNDSGAIVGMRGRRRRRKHRKKDPSHPKPSRSGYNFFFAEQHARLKALYPNKNQNREISRMIGELWNNLNEADKAVYQGKGEKDKERYRSELKVYGEKLSRSLDQVLGHAVPIRQLPPERPAPKMDSRMGTEEGNLLPTHSSECSSTESDSEVGGSSKEDTEIQTTPESGATGAESTAVVEDNVSHGEGFELRRRQEVGIEDKHEVASLASVSVEEKHEVADSGLLSMEAEHEVANSTTVSMEAKHEVANSALVSMEVKDVVANSAPVSDSKIVGS